jgi:hypothetical protein
VRCVDRREHRHAPELVGHWLEGVLPVVRGTELADGAPASFGRGVFLIFRKNSWSAFAFYS